MCDPTAIAIGSAVLAGAGGLINQRQQSAALSERNRQNELATQRSIAAADAERDRQRQMEEEAFANLSKSFGAADDVAKGKPQEEVRDRLMAETAAAEPTLTISALPGQASGETDMARMIGREISEKADTTQKQLEALATLTALGSAFSGLGDDINENSSDIQTVNSKRRGSAYASRLETSIPPAEVRASDSPIGDIMMIGGQALGAFGGGLGGANQLTGAQRAVNATRTAPFFSPMPTPKPALPF